MSVKHITNKHCCPFWSAETMKCCLCKGGLFIPLDDHKDLFCTTPEYPQCMQYSLQSDAHETQPEVTSITHHNRRKYTRFETQHIVTLVKLKKSGAIVTHLTAATTIDISKGGMRLFSEKPLINNTSLQFSFDGTFPENLQSGIGQVEWCNKQIDSDGYQSGISFHSQQIVEAMGLYLQQRYN